jgi:hypothetical protein
MTIILLILLGLVGGAYLIPFDAFLQVNSPIEKRGRIIAAANFFSFVGVLLAAIALYFLSEELGCSAASGFAIMGVLAFVANIVVTGRLSDLFFPFLMKKVVNKFRHIELMTPIPSTRSVVILESDSWWDALLLFSCLPRLKILLPDRYFQRFPWVNGLVDSFQIVHPEPTSRRTLEKLFKRAKKFQKKSNSVCLFFHRRSDSAQVIEAYTHVFGQFQYGIVYARRKERAKSIRWLGLQWHQKITTLGFYPR